MSFSMSPFPLQFGTRQGGGGGWTADIYVNNSVNGAAGDDMAAGTIDAPLLTLAAATAAAEVLGGAVKIGLIGGSDWRVTSSENLRPAGLSGLDVRGVLLAETDPFPHLNCLQTLNNASFSKTGGQTNVYEIAVPHDMSGTEYVIGYEDGSGLTAVSSVANCDSTVGSYYTTNTTANNQVLYIHPAGSTDPTSDGKVYEATATGRAIGTSTYESRCERLSFTGPGSKDGPVDSALGSGSNRLIVRKGHIHHLLGAHIYEKLALYDVQNVAPRGLSGSSPFVGYSPLEAEEEGPAARITELYVHSTFACAGYFQHTQGGTLLGGYLRNYYGRFAAVTSVPAEMSDSFIRMPGSGSTSHPIVAYDDATITNVVLLDSRGYVWNNGDGVVTVDDCRFEHSDSSNPSNGGFFLGDVVVNGSTVVAPSTNFNDLFADGNSISLTNSIVSGLRNIINETTDNPPDAMDGNVYYAGIGNSQWWRQNNVQYANLAAWQAAPDGLDANSAQADPLLSDPANNDWTFTGASPADTGGRTAGSRSHVEEPDWSALVALWDQHYLGFDGHVPPP